MLIHVILIRCIVSKITSSPACSSKHLVNLQWFNSFCNFLEVFRPVLHSALYHSNKSVSSYTFVEVKIGNVNFYHELKCSVNLLIKLVVPNYGCIDNPKPACVHWANGQVNEWSLSLISLIRENCSSKVQP